MSRRLGRNKIFQKFLDGTLTDADILASSHLTDTHHRKSRGQGGNNKKSNKNKISALDHRIWHYFTKNSTLEELADKISNNFVSRDSRFFVVNIDNIIASLVKISNWIEKSTNGNYTVRIKIKEKSKIIKFEPLNHALSAKNLSS